MESVINKAIEWFKTISEATKELTSGNVSHKACAIRGMANRSAEYLEKHKGSFSVIKWQTGNPKEDGEYLVSLEDGSVCRDEWRELYCEDDIKCWVYNEGEVTAWCKLSDIKSYKAKEETK